MSPRFVLGVLLVFVIYPALLVWSGRRWDQ